MVYKSLVAATLAAFSLSLIPTSHAAPVLFCSSGPGIDLVADGCISGTANSYPGGGDGIYSNAGGGDPEVAVEAAILAATGSAVDITLLGKSDANPGLFTFDGDDDPSNDQSGTWSVDAMTVVRYITVKAANSFALFEIAPASFSGMFSSDGILNNGGSQPDVSHISFWTSQSTPQISEPAALGLFGLSLAALASARRRRLK